MSKLDRRSFIKKTSLSGAALASSTLFTGSSQKKISPNRHFLILIYLQQMTGGIDQIMK